MDKDALELIKDMPYVIAILLFSWLIVKTIITGIVKAFDIWGKLASARNEIDIKRTALDERTAETVTNIVKVMETTGKTLEAVVGRLEKLVAGENEIKEAVVGSSQVVLARMDKHDASMVVAVDELKLIRDQQYAALNSRLDAIVKELSDVAERTKELPTVAQKVSNIAEMVVELKSQIKVNEAAQEKKDNGGA